MDTEIPFTDMDVVEQRLRLLRQQRDRHLSQFHRHWDALKDHEHRGVLLKDAVQDVVRSWKPAQMIRGALEPATGLIPMVVRFFGMGGGLKRRTLVSLLSVAAPMILKRVDFAKVLGSLFRSSSGTNGHAKHEPHDPVEGTWP